VPEFDESDLDSAWEQFNHRERRFGGASPATLYSRISTT